jgi:sugar O-acyltransferase (sialic acid O-acetyltransferase NeuD family)
VQTQAEAPAPPQQIGNLEAMWGRRFRLPAGFSAGSYTACICLRRGIERIPSFYPHKSRGSVKDVVVVGARGLGKEVAGYLEQHGGYRIICVLDEIAMELCLGYPIVHPDKYTGTCRDAILAVGRPEHKRWVLERYAPLHLRWLTLIHPSASVSRSAHIGEGSIIGPQASITGDAWVSELVLVNISAAIAHDAVVGGRSTIAPYGFIAGGACLGDDCMIAAGAMVLPGVRIGDRSRVSAGSAVYRDVPPDVLACGDPARCTPDLSMRTANAEAGQPSENEVTIGQ